MASGSKKVIIAALIGNGLISVTKFVAASMTGSSAMLSEGIHSVVDTGNQVLLLFGLRQSAKPAGKNFPFGHGKEIYFWSFVVSILIFAVGAGISIYEGVHHIMDPSELKDPTINYIVLGLAIIFEGGALYFAVTEFNKVRGKLGYLEAVKRGKDPSMFVVLFEDSAAMLGLLIALVGIYCAHAFNLPVLDGVASVMIGIILAVTAIWLAIETKGLLIGESADPEVIQGIQNVLSTRANVMDLNEILTLHMGPEYILATISIHFKDELKVEGLEVVISEITKQIKAAHPNVKRVFIEAEDRKTA